MAPKQKVKIVPYKPHKDDPPALRINCPVCPAKAGTWCGGKDDVHQERVKAAPR